jgi:CheY-like chemotaxis protein
MQLLIYYRQKILIQSVQLVLCGGSKMSLNILLVDDCDVNQKVASLMLKKLGYKADFAANGIEAIEALEKKPYEIVLMDIQMPEMDGLEATKIIRKRWHQSPKIIVVTALSNYREACLEAGADEFLIKPLGIEELRESIQCHNTIPSFTEFMAIEPITYCG